MPWYAQRADLPDTHKLWADPGSRHEAVLKQIDYVEVPAPGQAAEVNEQNDADTEDAPPVDEPEQPANVAPVRPQRRR